MNRRDDGKPFYAYMRDEYADEITIRCASNDEVVETFRLGSLGRAADINKVHNLCDRINDECRIAMSKREHGHDGDGKDKEYNQNKDLFERLLTVHQSIKETMAKLQQDMECVASAIDIIYAKVNR